MWSIVPTAGRLLLHIHLTNSKALTKAVSHRVKQNLLSMLIEVVCCKTVGSAHQGYMDKMPTNGRDNVDGEFRINWFEGTC